MLKSLSSLLLLIFAFTGIVAQQVIADSLKQQLTHAKKDTSKVLLLLKVAAFYQWSNPDSAISYSQEALKLAELLNFQRGQNNAYAILGEAFSGQGNYPKALEAALKLLEVAQKSGDPFKIARANVAIGNVYFYSSDYRRALYYYNKIKSDSVTFNQWKGGYSGFLGETYFHLNQLDSALYYLKISYDIVVKSNVHWPVPYYYLGEIDALRKEYDKALKLYHGGIEHSVDKLDSLNGYIGIAGIFKKMVSTDSATFYARQALGLVPDGSFTSQIVRASEILTDIYKTRGLNDSVLKYTQIMMVAKDSLFSRAKQNLAFNEQTYQQDLQQKIEQQQLKSRNKQNIIILLSGLVIALIVAVALWRRNIYKQRSYSILQKQKEEIDTQKTKVEKTLDELKTTQSLLIQSEKMASLGELTAGIAHEIQNPLNFVNNFSEVNYELIGEINEQWAKGCYCDCDCEKGDAGKRKQEARQQAMGLSDDLKQNLEKVIHHGKRADAIVKGMLQHSRTATGQKEPTDINALADEYLRLAYHGLRAKDNLFNAKIETDFDPSIGKINIISQDIGRALLNLYNNAFYAVNEKANLRSASGGYEPRVTVRTSKVGNRIESRVKDNGNGIPAQIREKIFQPFFTTKPTGQGTGLGLSLAYDIVKANGGELKVETKEGEGSEFIVSLPVNKST